jgi:hypothetical protein
MPRETAEKSEFSYQQGEKLRVIRLLLAFFDF